MDYHTVRIALRDAGFGASDIAKILSGARDARQEIAARAMGALIATNPGRPEAVIAKLAVSQADALIAALDSEA